jgi:hypothetical protein
VQTSGTEDEDAQVARQIGEAYNLSIYMMVGTPYLLLGGFTFYIWRGLKKNREYLRAQGKLVDPDAEAHHAPLRKPS